jgi:hypothetical protein
LKVTPLEVVNIEEGSNPNNIIMTFNDAPENVDYSSSIALK